MARCALGSHTALRGLVTTRTWRPARRRALPLLARAEEQQGLTPVQSSCQLCVIRFQCNLVVPCVACRVRTFSSVLELWSTSGACSALSSSPSVLHTERKRGCLELQLIASLPREDLFRARESVRGARGTG